MILSTSPVQGYLSFYRKRVSGTLTLRLHRGSKIILCSIIINTVRHDFLCFAIDAAVCIYVSCLSFLSASSTLLEMRPVSGLLSGKVTLPCYFSIIPTVGPRNRNASGTDYLRIKWTKIEGGVESTVLVTQNGVIKIGSGYRSRVSVQSHPEDIGDASLTMVKLRASDAGTYRCEVMFGIEDTQDTVSLNVDGKKSRLLSDLS